MKNCSFISKRRLQIVFEKADSFAVTAGDIWATYEVEILNLPTPAQIPADSVKNQIRVLCFLASDT